jgi:tRNA nucleotidyltransferase/poly(A) polymerase
MTHNIRLFEVGGSIRDEMLGIDNPPDRDFCAESPDGWEALLAWCHMNMKRVFLVTPEFFTVRGMMHNGMSIDVVMCRKDGTSSDGRHPDNVTPGTLMDDLARRDFTMNAMAIEVDPDLLCPIGTLIDPFGGAQDVRWKLLRAVGKSNDRFAEDGLRILRAARFCVTKNVSPMPDIQIALQTTRWWAFLLQTVSEERIREELNKMMKFDCAKSLKFLIKDCAPDTMDLLLSNNIWLQPTLKKK